MAADSLRTSFERTYPTSRFAGFEPALEAFLRDARTASPPFAPPSRAAIAFAGTANADGGALTNRPAWRIERKALQSRAIAATFLNDFEALAYGVAHAGPGDWLALQPATPVAHGNIALVGAGTGLGVAALVWNGSRYRALASEGGHIGFAPQDEAQVELWRELRARHRRVSAERVVSGAGLVAVYDLLRSAASENAEALDDPAEIAQRALGEHAGIAGRALDLFLSCYGTVAGDLALAFLARGGVYVCGGIAAKLAPRIGESGFLAAFNDKGRHRGLTASMPVRVVTNEKLGLLGAAYAAGR
jgi:glucokinase